LKILTAPALILQVLSPFINGSTEIGPFEQHFDIDCIFTDAILVSVGLKGTVKKLTAKLAVAQFGVLPCFLVVSVFAGAEVVVGPAAVVLLSPDVDVDDASCETEEVSLELELRVVF